ncbi:MAG TPA: hypothetical protein VIY86_10060 [Pirellulaceae bacterium]
MLRPLMNAGLTSLWLLILGIHATSARCETVEMNPIADTFVSSTQPNGNFGSAGVIAISAPGLPLGEFQSVIRFDTSTAKAAFDLVYGIGNWSIQGIGLRGTAGAPNNPIFNPSAAGQIRIHWMQNDSWTEGTGTPSTPGTVGLTFASLPAWLAPADEDLGSFNSNGSTSGTSTVSLGLMPGIIADLSSGSPASLRLFAADPAVSALFRSRSYAIATERLVLAITAVPEPFVWAGFMAFAPFLLAREGSRRPLRIRK